MSVVQANLPYDVSSDGNFDAIGLAIYNAIVTTMGWSEKADTGRTDWTTNPARPAAGSYLWNVFSPNDDLQTGDTAFYMKLEIGLNGSSQLSIRLQLGTDTNGSGTLSGYMTSLLTLPINGIANQGATLYECNFSGDPGRLGIVLFRTLTAVNAGIAIFVERTRDATGAYSSDGVIVLCATNATNGGDRIRNQVLVFTVGATPMNYGPTHMAGWMSAYNAAATSDTFANSVLVSPVFPRYGKIGNPMTAVAACLYGDVAEGVLMNHQLYGETRTFMAHKGVIQFYRFVNGDPSGYYYAMLMRYD